MKKSVIRVVALIICASMISSVSAVGVSEIDAIDSETKRGIQEQLEAQDALEMLDIHEYIYWTTNPSFVPYGSEDEYTNIYAPYGGLMEYQTRVNGSRVNVVNTYLDRNNSFYFVLEQQEIGIGDVIIAIAPFAYKAVKAGGIFITSGIIEDRMDDVTKALEGAGFEIRDVKRSADWAAFYCIKN